MVHDHTTGASTDGMRLGVGDLLDDRFEICGLLGRGRFSEVYEADDTRFHRHVALKIPFVGSVGSEGWRIVHEVKAAQSVSHPNVMRVWELGSFADPATGRQRPFISCELIEGGTLRRRLSRRLGGLDRTEALNIAHDLCAAVDAIHRQDLLHRDLKPENVLLTKDGRAIIADLGLATLAGSTIDPTSGTVGYRAPELDHGAYPNEQSDLYSLGTMLFELFFGRMPFAEGEDRQTLPTLPADPDAPAWREELLRSLHYQPEKRHGSAAELARSLPPRPAPDAARTWTVPVETLLIDPTPRLNPTRHRWLMVSAILLLGLVVTLGDRYPLLLHVVRGEPPVVLEYRARDLLAETGLDRTQDTSDRVDRLRGYHPIVVPDLPQANAPPVAFWYRQSPGPLSPTRTEPPFVRSDDPRLGIPGERFVELDPGGRLLRLEAIPNWREPRESTRATLDWTPFLRAAGFDPAGLRPAEPEALSGGAADQRWAWDLVDPRPPDRGARLEAAALGGLPVAFRVTSGRGSRTPMDGDRVEAARDSDNAVLLAWAWAILVLGVGIALCRRHLHERVADLRGATRLATWVFVARFAVWLFGGQHGWRTSHLDALRESIERGLLDAGWVWILYVALEPIARRRWTWQVASWVRLLRGRWRDPLLGRDLLVGVVVGLALSLCGQLYAIVPEWLGWAAPRPDRVAALAGLLDDQGLARQLQAVVGLREAVAMSIHVLLHACGVAFLATVGVALLRRFLENPLWSRSIAVAVISIILFPSAGHPLADTALVVTISAVWVGVLVRFGFVPALTTIVVAWWMNSHPLTLDPNAWWAAGSAVPLVLVSATLVWSHIASASGFALGHNAPERRTV